MKKTITLLLTAVLFLATFSLGRHDSSLAAEEQTLQKVTLKIDGVTCGSCFKDIKKALLAVPGVESAEVTANKKWLVFNDLESTRAVVAFVPSKTSVEGLIKAVEGAGNAVSTYKATPVK